MTLLLKFISVVFIAYSLLGCSHNQTTKYIDAQVSSTIVEISPQAATDFTNAIALMNAQKLDQALDAFKLMTQDYPELSGPYANLGVIHSRKKNWNDAEAYLLKAYDKNKQNYKALTQLAYVYRNMGKFNKAKNYYEMAIEASPSSPEIYLNLGILLDIYMGDLSQARLHYEKYQSLQPNKNRTVEGWIVDINRRGSPYPQVVGESDQ